MRFKIKILIVTISGIIAYIILAASCIPKTIITVNGQLFGRPFKTTVDNELAKLILINQSDRKVINLFENYNTKPLDNNTLSELTRNFSADVSTLYFLNREYLVSKNKIAQDLYYSFSQQLQQTKDIKELKSFREYLIAFVPGFAYNSDTTTGANFARQRRLMNAAGIQTTLIETDEWGLVDNNAKIISERLKTLSLHYNKIIIVSASKGGLETAISIGKLLKPGETSNIKAWISVGGILKGTPIADQYLSAPRCWFAAFMLWTKGKKMDVVKDMSYNKRVEDFKQLQFPTNIKIIHFVAAPLATQISKSIKYRYCSLIKYGPNDGLTTLTDELTENGIVVSEIGLDHYFKDPNIDTKTFALACVAMKIQY